MHSDLTARLAQAHVADLRRNADRHRVPPTDPTSNRSDAGTDGRSVRVAPVTLLHRLRRRRTSAHPVAQ